MLYSRKNIRFFMYPINRVQPIQRKQVSVLWKSVNKKVSIVQYNTGLRNYRKIVITRKHSSRMCTNCLEAIHAPVSVATTRCHSRRGYPTWTSLNRPPVITSAEGVLRSDVPGGVGGKGERVEAGSKLPNLSCSTMTYPMMHLMLPTPPPVNKQTPVGCDANWTKKV